MERNSGLGNWLADYSRGCHGRDRLLFVEDMNRVVPVFQEERGTNCLCEH